MPEKEKKITTIWDAISDLNYLDSGEGANEQDYLNAPMTEYQEKIRAGSKKLFGHIATNHSEVALTRMRMIPPKGGKEFLPPEQLTKSIYSGTWERMDADDVSVTITTRFDTPASGKNRMPGFSTFFKSTSLDELVNLVPTLRDTLKQSPWSVQRAFLVGVFDGRSSADIDKKKHKVRMLALDCISDDIGAFLSEMVEMTGIRYNYNTHRDRLKGGRPRNPQLRIRDVEDFMSKIGLISPRRVNLLKDAYEHNYSCVEIIEDSSTLLGLKTFNLK